MKKTIDAGKTLSHNVFLIFLAGMTLVAVAVLSLKGWGYYSTPIPDRPFRFDYQTMRPSGVYSQGIGIIGSAMIIIGVMTYSSRKRLRALWKLGSLSVWLEFHIVLCLVGPVLVVYHTTFKAGGAAAISLWSMLAVAGSGIIGRFLYVQIPRNIRGAELTGEELGQRMESLRANLLSTEAGARAMTIIDEQFKHVETPATLGATISTMVQLRSIRHKTLKEIDSSLHRRQMDPALTREIRTNATERISLYQKAILLKQVERVFFYWHAIHLPFTVIMFITLAAHVTVAYMLGYRWIF
jgi:hypothetical protein